MARYRGRYAFRGDELRSKFELRIAETLHAAKIKYKYESKQYEYFTKVTNGICEDCSGTCVYKRQWYTPDFFLPGGIVIEAKGHFTASNRTTLKAIRDAHPSLDLRLVFMADNRINRNSEMRYSDWCDKHGFQYAFKLVPEEWYKK